MAHDWLPDLRWELERTSLRLEALREEGWKRPDAIEWETGYRKGLTVALELATRGVSSAA